MASDSRFDSIMISRARNGEYTVRLSRTTYHLLKNFQYRYFYIFYEVYQISNINSPARTMKIEELEKELEEEVAQFKSTNKSGIQLDSVKVR